MRDHELYATILGVTAPWAVERVEVDVAGGAVHVWLQRDATATAECPTCGTARTIYDHREREWRHLDTCQLQMRIHARVPRVDCPTHGVLQSSVPWATPAECPAAPISWYSRSASRSSAFCCFEPLRVSACTAVASWILGTSIRHSMRVASR